MATIKTESIVQRYIITLSPEEAAKLAYLLQHGISAQVSDTLVQSLASALYSRKEELRQELDRSWTDRRTFYSVASFTSR